MILQNNEFQLGYQFYGILFFIICMKLQCRIDERLDEFIILNSVSTSEICVRQLSSGNYAHLQHEKYPMSFPRLQSRSLQKFITMIMLLNKIYQSKDGINEEIVWKIQDNQESNSLVGKSTERGKSWIGGGWILYWAARIT